MTVKECYDAMNGNYDDAKGRLMTDKLIEKFMLKFPGDQTMQSLTAALEAEDYEAAFARAHTLKGVAANLGFTALRNSASELTERLRFDKTKPEDSMVTKVTEDYNRIIDVLRTYQNA